MVLDFYKLRKQPFGVTPDPAYLYLSDTHREALSSLLYGISAGRGFMTLIAKPGMGKTTLLFDLMRTLGSSAKTVFLFQTLCTPVDFLSALLEDLGIKDHDGDMVRMQAKLNKVLLREYSRKRRLVVVIDEAQNLDDSVLEVVRMLSNFESPSEKLIQIVLTGQPQLADRLASAKLVQLRQRVSIVCRLKQFNVEETALYIDHRLRVAGYKSETPLFTDRALALIAKLSQGIPRNINNICFNALSLGCVLKQKTIDKKVIQEVQTDLDIETLKTETDLSPTAPEPRWKFAVSVAQQVRDLLRQISVPQQVKDSLQQIRVPRFAIAAAVLLALSWLSIRPSSQVVHATAPQPFAPSEKSAGIGIAVPRLGASKTASSAKISGGVPSRGQRSQESRGLGIESGGGPPKSPGDDALEATRSVRAYPNQTLSEICVHYFGKYNEQILAELEKLNPRLSDPDFIVSGQQIRIPSATEVSGESHAAVEQAPNVSTVNGEKP